jgi:hypothetical protein
MRVLSADDRLTVSRPPGRAGERATGHSGGERRSELVTLPDGFAFDLLGISD